MVRWTTYSFPKEDLLPDWARRDNIERVFISVINQLDAQNFCFTISFISCLYMFRVNVLIIRRSKLHYTACGIITPVGGHLVHRLRGMQPSLNLCTRWQHTLPQHLVCRYQLNCEYCNITSARNKAPWWWSDKIETCRSILKCFMWNYMCIRWLINWRSLKL